MNFFRMYFKTKEQYLSSYEFAVVQFLGKTKDNVCFSLDEMLDSQGRIKVDSLCKTTEYANEFKHVGVL